MADYDAAWRSNPFAVRDRAAFSRWAGTVPDMETQERADGRFVVLQRDAGDGGLPSWREAPSVDGPDDLEEIDFLGEIGAHVAPGEVLVLLEAGSQRLRCVAGFAWAVRGTAHGRAPEVVAVSLDDIYAHAAAAFGVDRRAIAPAFD